MMRFCLMEPRNFSWDRLIWMNRQWKGIVFVDFQNEKPPRFILDLVEELQREKITDSSAPCQTFSKSFMMVSPATKRKDLVLTLRDLTAENMSLLEKWRNNQGEQIMVLSDYVKEFAAEFTGIEKYKSAKTTNDAAGKSEQKKDDSTKKSKKERRKKNHPSEPSKEINDDAVNETASEETTTTDDGVEKPDDDGADVSDEAKEGEGQ